MPFDPTKPANASPNSSAEMRDQLNGLNDLITAARVPVGMLGAWCKDLPNVPPLPPEWAECNGQVLSDAQSPLDGVTLPNLNAAGLFLRGHTNSGNLGGTDYFATRTADNASVGTPFNAVTIDDSPGATPIPPYYSVVWIIRVR